MLTFQPKASPFAPRNLEIKLFQGGRRCHALSDASDVDAPADKGVVGKVCGRLDIAKSVFLVHGVDAAGHEVLRQKLSRSRVLEFFANLPRCLVGIEACASSHYWACELITQGHEVKLMPAQYVKPYVKRGKNDAADAEAICEAVTRPTMRVVGVKTVEQQSTMTLHRVRLILMRQRTQLSNALRSHLAEFGIVSAIGRVGLDRLLTIVADRDDGRVAC